MIDSNLISRLNKSQQEPRMSHPHRLVGLTQHNRVIDHTTWFSPRISTGKSKNPSRSKTRKKDQEPTTDPQKVKCFNCGDNHFKSNCPKIPYFIRRKIQMKKNFEKFQKETNERLEDLNTKICQLLKDQQNFSKNSKCEILCEIRKLNCNMEKWSQEKSRNQEILLPETKNLKKIEIPKIANSKPKSSTKNAQISNPSCQTNPSASVSKSHHNSSNSVPKSPETKPPEFFRCYRTKCQKQGPSHYCNGTIEEVGYHKTTPAIQGQRQICGKCGTKKTLNWDQRDAVFYICSGWDHRRSNEKTLCLSCAKNSKFFQENG